jgi:hypothetical protein
VITVSLAPMCSEDEGNYMTSISKLHDVLVAD